MVAMRAKYRAARACNLTPSITMRAKAAFDHHELCGKNIQCDPVVSIGVSVIWSQETR
jgi:hypothetical protein